MPSPFALTTGTDMQTRRQSLIEAFLSSIAAFVTSVMLGMVIYPLFGHRFSVGSNIAIVSIFTVWSFIRSYWTRRFFNWIEKKYA